MNSCCSSITCSVSVDIEDEGFITKRFVQRKRGMFRRANSIESLYGQPKSSFSRPLRVRRVLSDPQSDTKLDVIAPPLLVPRWDSQSSPKHRRKSVDTPPSTARLTVMRSHSRRKVQDQASLSPLSRQSLSPVPQLCRWGSDTLVKDSKTKGPPQPARQLSPMRAPAC
ncbi:expressed unknown protein [Seminavis robusta]|uniref:Uncharacterized protein n=1 Tax=Seminavis robusta TaxID=568900 RepID=A0A9N8HNL7_9STRA|nr:expressed unknown protein [Seminavis robusta]|eukprot:Sro1096_g240790.1 n/a (168) ;mRNA; f:20886-21389